jgi:2-polyprenyl-6-methoxyphenol hydroxylase-like FAD-dependent oxidoreductase
MASSDVLVVGAGPTGLVLGLWLTKEGIKVRIIDKAAEPGTTSRALAVQARTLELYRQLDLAETIVAKGHRVNAANFWVQGTHRARFLLNASGTGLTPYPFMQIFPQDEHEKLLIARLQELGVSVERPTELTGLVERRDGVTAHLRHGDGDEEDCETRYLAGCDGARSKVRETIGTGFPGGTYPQIFYVADIEATGPALNGELHINLDEADFVAIFPLAEDGRARLVGVVRKANAETLSFADVSNRAIDHMKVTVAKVNWFSTYHVHHRVAQHFRKGRVFLAGDAAHIHSPAGGQGMNTGIGDAINLAWKLAAALNGRAPDALLDSYEAERIGFARRLVATTDQVFTFASAEGKLADFVRTRIAPLVIPAAYSFEAVRRFAFRTVSQTMLNYRGGALSQGGAGRVWGGDRLPWAVVDGSDNFEPLSSIGWQVHVYGAARDELTAWCTQRKLPLHVFPWRDDHARAGLARDALYLLRPDTYVALADASGSATALDSYVSERGIKLP